MPLKPKLSDAPRIRGAISFYRAFAYITGTFLLLLTVEVIVKFILGFELEIGGTHGAFALVARGTVHAINGSTAVLIIHGWLYVVYLFSDFRLWSLLRWPFSRFILIALGGVIPFMSFITEHFITRRARIELAELEATAPSQAPTTATEATH